ncbi:transposase [Streptomyces sp. 11-1-2]|uniref:transposase n=1 Tax=Streptomyces sp. Mo3 TaxID=3161190 RepID=UPI001F09E39C|nr:transposase [Streptomyces sp. 11-1-2]
MFFDESGVSLLPRVRRTCAPRGRTPTLRHRLNWKRAGMAAALGYHAADLGRGPRLCFHLKPGSYDTTFLIEVLEHVKTFYAGESVVLVWDGLSARWSRSMRAWAAEQDWLSLSGCRPTHPNSTQWNCCGRPSGPASWPTSPATTSPMSPTRPNAASTGSAPTNNSRGPSSLTPD